MEEEGDEGNQKNNAGKQYIGEGGGGRGDFP